MTDVIHDPRTDWCACEPFGMNRCGYRRLADTVIGKLNPHDGDDAEVSLCIAAVEQIAAYVRTLPCECARTEFAGIDKPCNRCSSLGLWYGRPL